MGIKIYKLSFGFNQNYIIEDLEDYLTSLGANYTDDNFQLLNTFATSIKIDLSSSSFCNLSNKNEAAFLNTIGNYLRVSNKANGSANNVIYYYYIIGAAWASDNSVLLSIRLDSINTFYDSYKSHFTIRTKTKRQHKDRFYNVSYGSGYYVRRFYDTNEGFNPHKYLIDKQYWNDSDSYGLTGETQNFYLIDKTPTKLEQESTNKVIKSYLTFDNSVPSREFVKGEAYINMSQVISKIGNVLSIGVIDCENNPNLYIQRPLGGDQYAGQKFAATKGGRCICIVEYSNADSKWVAKYIGFNADNTLRVIESNLIDNSSLWTLTNCYKMHIHSLTDSTQFLTNYPMLYQVEVLTQTSGSDTLIVSDYSKVDTSDNLINNIFILPYSPINLNIVYSGGQYLISTDEASVDTDDDYLLLLKENIEYKRSWNIYYGSILSTYEDFIFNDNLLCKVSEASAIELESRLYNSEFYSWGIYFAGQQTLISNEKFYFSSQPTESPKFKLNYVVSNSFSGHFIFKMEWVESWKYLGLNNPQDLTISIIKDNRAVLYQNNYLDYRRTMQYYDKQALATAEAQTWQHAGASMISSLFMALLSSGGNPVVAGVGLVASVASSLSNAIYSQINNENAQIQKEAQLAAQRSNIRSGADMSLQLAIDGNKLYFVKYGINSNLRQNIYKYFKLYGYSCNDYGVPSLNTRKWFNYIECEADFDESNVSAYSSHINDIKAKFMQGCTIFHHDTINNLWDIDQANENWEIWFNN